MYVSTRLDYSETAKVNNARMVIRKGKLVNRDDPNDPGVTMFNWDAIPFCSVDECPAHDLCDFNKTSHIRCGAQNLYLKHVVQALVMDNPIIDDDMSFRIGTELMPLYNILFGFLIELVGVDKRIWIAKGGKPFVHPVYKELRETIKMVALIRDKIGIPKSTKNPSMQGNSVFSPSGRSPEADAALKKMRRRR